MMNFTSIMAETGLSLNECRQYRIEYLKSHIKELSGDVAWLADDDGELSPSFCQQVFDQLVIEAKELRHLTMILKGDYQQRPNEITEAMIQSARDYPIEQLIDFDGRGQAIAFCHADSTPSLTWHRARNRATCFPCVKSYNSIDVLMKRDGVSFRDAVRQLAS